MALWPVALTLGDLAVRLGQPDASKPHYEKALAVAERVGVPRWVEAAQRGRSATRRWKRSLRRAWRASPVTDSSTRYQPGLADDARLPL